MHRDLKPGNIMLVRSGDTALPKIIDFGLARATNRDLLAQSIYTERDLSPPTPQSGLKVIHKELATQQYLVQISAGPATDDDDRFAMRMMATIVGDDSGSRLYWELVETGLAESAAI